MPCCALNLPLMPQSNMERQESSSDAPFQMNVAYFLEATFFNKLAEDGKVLPAHP